MLRIHKSKKFFENEDLLSYDGREDTDMSVWFNESFLNDKFDEYNRRFFNNLIPKIHVTIGGVSAKRLGCCVYSTSHEQVEMLNAELRKEIAQKSIRSRSVGQMLADKLIHDLKIEQHVDHIQMTDGKFASRFYFEETLVHEMCHAYQLEVLCKGLLSMMKIDNATGSGGHGHKFFEAAKIVNDHPDNKEGFHITQYASAGEMSRKAYKTADGLLSIECLNNVMIKVSFVSKTKMRQALLDMQDDSYLFMFADGDVKAEFKPSRTMMFTLTENFTRKIEEAIKDGRLVLYAVNRKGEFNCHVLTEDERQDSALSDYMEICDVMDCETLGFQCYPEQVKALFDGNAPDFANRIAYTLKSRINRIGRFTLYAAPETFVSMFTVGDESLVGVVSESLENVKSKERKSLNDLLSLNGIKPEHRQRTNMARRYEGTSLDDVEVSDIVNDVLLDMIGSGGGSVAMGSDGSLTVIQE